MCDHDECLIIFLASCLEKSKYIKTKRDKFIQMRNKLFLDPRYMKNPLYYYVRAVGDVDGVDIYSPDAKANGNYVSKEQATHYINGVAVPWEQSANEYKPLELK